MARKLALEITLHLRDGTRTPSIGKTLYLLALHHGDLPKPTDETTKRQLAALGEMLWKGRTGQKPGGGWRT